MSIFYDRPTKYSSAVTGNYMSTGVAPMRVGASFWKYRRFTVGIGEFVTANGDYIEHFGKKYLKVQYKGATGYIREDYLLKMHTSFAVPTLKSNTGSGKFKVKTAFQLRVTANPQSAGIVLVPKDAVMISYGYYNSSCIVFRYGDYVGYYPSAYVERIGD